MSHERILLIEDNAVNRRLAQFLLKSKATKSGKQPTHRAFATCESAGRTSSSWTFNCGGGRLTATRHLKADPAPGHPVVAVTSYA